MKTTKEGGRPEREEEVRGEGRREVAGTKWREMEGGVYYLVLKVVTTWSCHGGIL